mgnify:CR=1 FL=1
MTCRTMPSRAPVSPLAAAVPRVLTEQLHQALGVRGLHQALEQGLVLQQAGGLGILHEFVQIGLGICHTISSISIIYKTDHSIL